MIDSDRLSRPSWVTPELVAGRTIGLGELRAWHGRVFWLESRPAAGRTVLVGADPAGTIRDVTDAAINVGTRVHEYGGGAYALGGSGAEPVVIVSDRMTGAVWRLEDGAASVWAGAADLRFADFRLDPLSRAAVAVREDHRPTGAAGVSHAPEPRNTLVWLDGADPEGRVLAEGADFYASPRLSPDGARLAWIEWDHPAMPWEATRLMVADVQRAGSGAVGLADVRLVAGGDRESVMEPLWMPDGALVATTDRSGFWNPVDVLRPDGGVGGQSWPRVPAEIGLPHWVFGQTTMTPVLLGAEPALVCLAIEDGLETVRVLSRDGAGLLALGSPGSAPVVVQAAADLADTVFAWIETGRDAPAAIVTGTPGEVAAGIAPRVLRRATDLPADLEPGAIARAEALTFPTSGGTAHALYYAPAPDAASGAAPGSVPPMVVMAHGGPTGRASPAFSFKVQWWTSRGFAVLDVNYRGSTGFGRAYRMALDGLWAERDIEDVLAAVRFAIDTGRADPGACVIRGSSAGGLTVLGALARSDLFTAGTSLYGVTDLRALAAETHKFEARYLDGLVGAWPEAEAVYVARSPVTMAGDIRAPVLFLHGADDRVVPPEQARAMAEALRAGGVPVRHHVYDGEGHGFRQEATLLDAYQRELDFYLDVFAGRI